MQEKEKQYEKVYNSMQTYKKDISLVPRFSKSCNSVWSKYTHENVIFFTQADLINPKLYPKARKWRQNKIYNKTAEIGT